MPEFSLDLGEAADRFDALDAFTRSYVECAFWTSNDELEEASFDQLAPEALATMAADCAAFVAAHRNLLDATPADDNRHGHDFWLTRNGHGAGFWDRGYGEIGDKLSAHARMCGGCDLYRGDDGMIYVS